MYASWVRKVARCVGAAAVALALTSGSGCGVEGLLEGLTETEEEPGVVETPAPPVPTPTAQKPGDYESFSTLVFRPNVFHLGDSEDFVEDVSTQTVRIGRPARQYLEGDILVGDRDQPFVARVTNVRHEGGAATVQTVPATIGEAVRSGEFWAEFTPNWNDAVIRHDPGGMTYLTANGPVYRPGIDMNGQGKLSISGFVVCDLLVSNGSIDWENSTLMGASDPDLDGESPVDSLQASEGRFTVRITEGTIAVTPTLKSGYGFDGIGVLPDYVNLDMGLTLRFDVVVDVEVSGRVGFNLEHDLIPPIVVPLEALGFPGSVELELPAGLQLEAGVEGTATFVYRSEHTLRASAGWAPRLEPDFYATGNRDSVEIQKSLEWDAQGSVRAKLYFDPRIKLKLGRIVGPYFHLHPYVEAYVVWPLEEDRDDLFLGLIGTVGLELTTPVFGYTFIDVESGPIFDLQRGWDIVQPGPGDGVPKSPNYAPVARPSSVTVGPAGTLIQLSGSDPEHDSLEWEITGGPSHGNLGILNQAKGTVFYKPDAGYTGADTFRFTVSDYEHESAAAVVTITVTGTTAPPTPPANVSAAAGDKQVTVTWGSVSGATSYNLYYGTTSPVTKSSGTLVKGVTSPRVLNGLTNKKTYYFVVTASNAAGESAVSKQVSATPALLKSISLSPNTKSLTKNSAGWSLSGVTVKAIFGDNSSMVITNGLVWKKISGPGTFNPSTLYFTPGGSGTTIIRCTLTIAGVSKSADFTFTTKSPTSISLTPNTMGLTKNSAGYSLTSVKVKILYDDGSSSTPANGFTWKKISGPGTFNSSTLFFTPGSSGKSVIRCTLTASGGSIYADFTFTTKSPTSISLTPNAMGLTKNSAGYSLTSVKVKVLYDDGSSSTLGNGFTWKKISGPGTFNPSTLYFTRGKPGKTIIRCTLTASGGSIYADFTFTTKTLSKVTLSPNSKSLTKTAAGWSLTGVKVTGHFDDNSSSTFANGFTWKKISGPGTFNTSTLFFTPGAVGTTIIRCTLTVSGVSQSADFTFTIKTLSSVSLTPSSKNLSKNGSGWSVTNVKVKAHFNDGTSSTYANGFTWKKISGPGTFNANTLIFTPSGSGKTILRCTLTVAGVSKTADLRIISS